MALFARARCFKRPVLLAAVSATITTAGTLISVTLIASAATPPSEFQPEPTGTSGYTRVDLARTCAGETGFIAVAGQGPLCAAGPVSVLRLNGGRHVQITAPDTTEMLRHPAEAGAAAGVPTASPSSAASSSPPHCMTSASQPHVELYYAHFQGEADNFSVLGPDIQQQFLAVDDNYINYDAAHWFGLSMHLIVQCDTMGEPEVHDITLSTRLQSSNFSTIISDMNGQGHCAASQGGACAAPGPVHYWVFTDGNPVSAYGYAGQSTVIGDDSPGPGNAINSSDAYSVNYGYCLNPAPGTSACDPPYDDQGPGYGPQIFAHEDGHALGAVQLSAPHSSGAWHCYDGTDVMCYNDGGTNGWRYTTSDCPAAPNGTNPFDCGFDDYFNPTPQPGSYLATHWDVASPNNRWLDFQKVATSTSVSSSALFGVVGEPVTLTAAVTSPVPGATPAGNVSFTDNGATLGSVALDGGGVASVTTTTLPRGADTIVATYAGSSLYQGSTSAAVIVTMGRILPTSGYSAAGGVAAVLLSPGCSCPHSAIQPRNAPAGFRSAPTAVAAITQPRTPPVTVADESRSGVAGANDGAVAAAIRHQAADGRGYLDAVTAPMQPMAERPAGGSVLLTLLVPIAALGLARARRALASRHDT